MAQTFFRSELSEGPVAENAITREYVANDANIALFGPVILIAGASATKDLPKVGSTTTPGDPLVCGVCVGLPDDKIVAAGKLVIVLEIGLTKLTVKSADVALNAPLETANEAGKAQVQAAIEIASTFDNTQIVAGLNNIRKAFALAYSAVTSGANSVILAYVNITTCQGAHTAGA
jgi:hypothetical protein